MFYVFFERFSFIFTVVITFICNKSLKEKHVDAIDCSIVQFHCKKIDAPHRFMLLLLLVFDVDGSIVKKLHH